jgi:hypothetical protein
MIKNIVRVLKDQRGIQTTEALVLMALLAAGAVAAGVMLRKSATSAAETVRGRLDTYSNDIGGQN